MSTIRKRSLQEDTFVNDRTNKKKRLSSKGVNLYIPLNINIEEETSNHVEEPLYTQTEVMALLAKQEYDFRKILEEKLKEQFNIFNQQYIENIFKDYHNADCSYIN